VMELPKRIEDKIAYCPESGCWIWMGYTMPAPNGEYGHGHVHWKGKTRCVHRVVYELLRGSIPKGLDLDHLCRVRCCVNPDHLEPVTPQENIRRGENHSFLANKPYCPQGHPYSGTNLYIRPDGLGRGCKICRTIAVRQHKERKRNEQNTSDVNFS
jgi:hypothetical protein